MYTSSKGHLSECYLESSKLGFVLLEPGPDGIATDRLSKQKWKKEGEPTEESPTVSNNHGHQNYLERSSSLLQQESLLDT